ncbi:hypothetical protein FRIG_12635 [Frigoribacterium faeni]|uniref:hypothetical protein n=1 Tax=Frigoribacterium faeni TaxID=145483 RepID=UPI001FACD6C4|nr:hypothetical protein [Frigoribacterium faeni]MCJ0701968.1 hypothetical protein [Frigoribacterium faeni]
MNHDISRFIFANAVLRVVARLLAGRLAHRLPGAPAARRGGAAVSYTHLRAHETAKKK